VSCRGGVAAISDLNSRNGTRVNGVRREQWPLSNQDVVRLGDHVAIVRHQLSSGGPTGFEEHVFGLLGSERLARCVELVLEAANTRVPMVLYGESGTGKELLAHALHGHSGRAGALVPMNCAALSESLLDAELFGHEKGAFTDAHRARVGLVQRAHRGTLFLDEVAELSPSAQSKLLRVLQEGELLRVGAETVQPVDIRVVCASHKNLAELVQAGRFRLDLYHRLMGIEVAVPSLRERREDVLLLFAHFVRKHLVRLPRLGSALVEALCLYDWPGNVRELSQCAASMAALSGREVRWQRSHLPSSIATAVAGRSQATERSSHPPRALDLRHVERVLKANQGNVTRAAAELGIARQSLYKLLRAQGWEPERFR
jgi:DNA-binding NtrC family response regulator